jgi:hypothetical protein
MKAVLYNDNNIVTNIIVWDSNSTLNGQNYIVVEDDFYVSIGWFYANNKFTDPNPPEVIEIPTPQSLTDMILSNPDELIKLKQALGIA